MTTPVAMPVIIVLVQFYSGAGTAVPAPRQGNTAVMSTYFTTEDCNRDRQSRGNPQDFFCLEYRSEKYIDYVFPTDKQHQGANEVQPKASPVTGPQAPADPTNDIQVNGRQYKRVAGTWVAADVGPTRLTEADKPYIEPLVELKPEPPKQAEQAPKPKKVAQRPRDQRQAMFEGPNPLNAVARLFRDW